MKHALYLPNFGCFSDLQKLMQIAREAEAAGWDGLFIWDHIARDFPIPVVDPWVALACIALSTSRIRIGALITPLARRRPWKVAREAVSIDRLSAGRLIFGAGIGSRRDAEWANLSEQVDLKTRAEMLDEALVIVTALWEGVPVNYEGKHYRIRESQFLPRPFQSPRIPVWLAGWWPHKAPFRRASRWDGMFPEFPGVPEEEKPALLRQLVGYVGELRESMDGFDVACLGMPPLGGGRTTDLMGSYAEAGATWWMEPLNPDLYGGTWEGEWPYETMRARVRMGPLPS